MKSKIVVIALCAAGLAASLSSSVHGQPQKRHNRIVDLLSQGKVVLGWFATARTPDAAAKAAADPKMDFIFVNMEQVQNYKPGDVRGFLQALMTNGATRNPNDHPLMTRLPIFHDDPAAARQRAAEMLNLGVHAIVWPDMESGEEARQALAAMRFSGTRPAGGGDAPAYWGLSPEEYQRKADVYPINPEGELASIFIIESEQGIANSREITRERPTVAIPGPGTLSRVYNRDMAKVEQAIQTQLAACKEFNVPCGITAGPKDIEKRIAEGFRMIIIYDRDYAETMAIGRKAAGRETASGRSAAVDRWSRGETAFGIFAPSDAERGKPAVYSTRTAGTLAANPLYDFVFLNLEPRYDPEAIKAMVEGLRTGSGARKTLIVRIPTPDRDGLDAVRARIREAYALGADGVTVPHVRSLEEAKQVVGFFRETGADIWTPGHKSGEKLAMLMIEDAGALKQADEIAAIEGYSILACGIGSLTQALGGDRAAAEAGNQKVLAATKRAGLINMLTTSARDVNERVEQGFEALIAQGQDVDAVIRTGRAAAKR